MPRECENSLNKFCYVYARYTLELQSQNMTPAVKAISASFSSANDTSYQSVGTTDSLQFPSSKIAIISIKKKKLMLPFNVPLV